MAVDRAGFFLSEHLVILRKFILAGIVTAGLVASGMVEAHAQRLSTREYEDQVKATFIYNFSRFVEWPDGTFVDSRNSLTVCFLGANPFGGALESIRGKNVKGRKIDIKRLVSFSKMGACQILFVSSSERQHLKEILESAKRSRILTIGDMNQFAQDGGAVALSMRNDRIHFSVNLGVAAETGVKISSNVLKLATIVNYRRQGERR
jgi:YfiR/HmsC-like